MTFKPAETVKIPESIARRRSQAFSAAKEQIAESGSRGTEPGKGLSINNVTEKS